MAVLDGTLKKVVQDASRLVRMIRHQPCGLIVQGLTEIVPAHRSQWQLALD